MKKRVFIVSEDVSAGAEAGLLDQHEITGFWVSEEEGENRSSEKQDWRKSFSF